LRQDSQYQLKTALLTDPSLDAPSLGPKLNHQHDLLPGRDELLLLGVTSLSGEGRCSLFFRFLPVWSLSYSSPRSLSDEPVEPPAGDLPPGWELRL